MDPNKISLESIDKMFEYEKQARVIEQLDKDDLIKFAKLYCKLYLKQQEVISSLAVI